MGRPGRPRTAEPYRLKALNLSEDTIKLIEEYADLHNVSQKYIVEKAVQVAFKGKNSVILSLTSENESLRRELKVKSALIEKLQKENEYLKNKIEKLESEIEELKSKNNSSKILAKFREGTDELGRLAEEIKEHIREGATWREVLESLGITDVSSRMDILHKLYSPRYVKLRAGFIEKDDILVSEVLSDYVLEKQGRDGYDSYVFKKRG